MSEALIFASTNPQYDERLFIELQVQYMKFPSSHLGRTCCVQNNFCRQHVLQKEELLTKIYLYVYQNIPSFIHFKNFPELIYGLFYISSCSMTLHYILSVMPIELILMWQKYPWPFGQFGCRFATAISELVTHVTIIKIIIFTVER